MVEVDCFVQMNETKDLNAPLPNYIHLFKVGLVEI